MWCASRLNIGAPPIFSVFMNDLPRSRKHYSLSIYADDSTVGTNSKTVFEIEEKLNIDLEQVS